MEMLKFEKAKELSAWVARVTFSGAVKLFLVMTAVEMREKTVTETLKPLCEHAGMSLYISVYKHAPLGSKQNII